MSERLRTLAGGPGDPERPDGDDAGSGPRELVYNRRALLGDTVRGVLGLAATGLPSVFVRPLLAVEIVLLACAAIFAVYLARTLIRYRTAIRLDAAGVTERALTTRRIAWEALARVKLRYYTTRRGREDGWLVLSLTGAAEPGGRPARITVESQLSGFESLLGATAAAAGAHGPALDETSAHNFAAAGFPVRAPDEAEDGG